MILIHSHQMAIVLVVAIFLIWWSEEKEVSIPK